jgi:predicted flap endonuclease-1-like 5' DNA nuclease
MRSDYALYVVALIFFAITVISVVTPTFESTQRNASIVTTVVLGLLFAGVGYTQRPRPKIEITQAPPKLAPPPPPSTTQTLQAASQQTVETMTEGIPARTEHAKIELTAVKGIKEKRAEQLKALGIGSVQELANASATDLAKKLKISPMFTRQWIDNAKEIIAKS